MIQNQLTDRRQTLLFRAMQAGLVLVLLIGLYEWNISIVLNSVIALGITFLPAMLRRDYHIPLGAGITLWITTAVFFHAVGALGPYSAVWWWDHMTHVLSASIVAGVGYAATRAIDEHNEDIYLPPRFLFLFILLFVIAFGVAWELLEFLISFVSTTFGTGSILTQYGLEDTIIDLVFDTVGAVLFAILGIERITHVVDALREKLDDRAALLQLDTPLS